MICLTALIASPHNLELSINTQPGTSLLKRTFIRLDKSLKNLFGDRSAVAAAILGGIMIMIIGFATLVIGNYIVFAIITSLPALNESNYTTVKNSIVSYATTVIPLFGLGLMVLGFAIILYTLRSSMDTGSR